MAYAPAINLGPPQWLTTRATIVNNFDPLAAGNVVVDVTNYVPAGAVGVMGVVAFLSTAAGDRVSIRVHDGTDNLDQQYNPIANQTVIFHFVVRLNATMEFDYWVSDARVNGVYLFLTGYYMGG
jgi:hypothetical protein